ncbi:DedA family protein [Paracoccus sp. TK19116]|uniref:DedA family protein n=1 Tax=Paracoccus albicereus TaxID=2922394 RepID=A0ABT1MPA4_9RHOB|nr:DedA family protein [Paracoccus albicereus]MCQ0970016.1 DedA family protein [Paracoccus albicereus]
MTHDLLSLLPTWGPWLIALAAFMSCLSLPIPTSVLLLSAGALSGTGHLHLPALVVAAVIGATLGDLLAFSIAKRVEPFIDRPGTRRAALLGRARAFITRRGMMAVFLSRWLITPLGPATNYVAGMAGLPLPRFALASISGEVLWAVIHLGAGHLFGRQFRDAEGAAIKALAVAAILGLILWGLRVLWHRRGRPAP